MGALELAHLSDEDIDALGANGGVDPTLWYAARKALITESVARQFSALSLKQMAGEETFYTHYPSFIANGIAAYRSEFDPVLKLWNACDTVELLLRFLVFLCLGDLERHRALTVELLRREIWPRIEEPTLGKWEGMAVALSKAIGHLGEKAIAPEIPNFMERMRPFLEGPGKQRDASFENAFLQLRNQLAHGGGVTKAAAGHLVSRWDKVFMTLMARAEFLKEFSCITPYGSGWRLLGADTLEHASFDPVLAGFGASDGGEPTESGHVMVVRGDHVVSLWPFCLFGVPEQSRVEMEPPTDPVPQLYVRMDAVRLQYTCVGSVSLPMSETSEAALEAFRRILRYDAKASRRERAVTVRGFEDDVANMAAKLIGRACELRLIVDVLKGLDEGVVWMSGEGGIGKSYVIAKTLQMLGEEVPSATILPFRFKLGDDRCSRQRFLQFATERLEAMLLASSHKLDIGLPAKATQSPAVLKERLEALGDRKVYFCLDGLDEIAESDPNFASELPLALACRNVVWFCSGRPSHGLDRVFSSTRCTYIFDGGTRSALPRMEAGDIRAMLLEKSGSLRKKLVANDLEMNGKIVNPFVEKVINHADGLPIYVTYIIGDILSNRFTQFDGTETLPPTIRDYHEKSLGRVAKGIGPVQQILTPLIASLAVAQEPVSIGLLTDLLTLRSVLDRNVDGEDRVEDALSALGSLITQQSTPDSDTGFILFHTSLRQHLLASKSLLGPVHQAETSFYLLCRTRLDTPSCQGYIRRHIAHHYFKEGDVQGFVDLLMEGDNDQLNPMLDSAYGAVVDRLHLVEEERDHSVVSCFVRALSKATHAPLLDLIVDLFEIAFPYGGWLQKLFMEEMERCVQFCSPVKGVQALLRMNTAITSGGGGELKRRYLEEAERLSRTGDARSMRPMVLIHLAFREDVPLTVGLRYIEEAHGLAFEEEHPIMQWETCFNQGRYLNISWNFEPAATMLADCVNIFEGPIQPLRAIWARGKLATVLLRQGHFSTAILYFDNIQSLLATYFPHSRMSVHIRLDEYRAWLGFLCGDTDWAADAMRACYSEYVKKERKEQLRALCRLINGCLDASRLEVVQHCERSLEKAIASRVANVSWHAQIWALQTLGRLLARKGNFGRSEALFDQADALAKAMEAEHYCLVTRFYRAEVEYNRGQTEHATYLAEQSFREIGALGERVIQYTISRFVISCFETLSNRASVEIYRAFVDGFDQSIAEAEVRAFARETSR